MATVATLNLQPLTVGTDWAEVVDWEKMRTDEDGAPVDADDDPLPVDQAGNLLDERLAVWEPIDLDDLNLTLTAVDHGTGQPVLELTSTGPNPTILKSDTVVGRFVISVSAATPITWLQARYLLIAHRPADGAVIPILDGYWDADNPLAVPA